MQPKELRCKISSVGAWGSYFESWEGLKRILNDAALPEEKNKGPKPTIIPANERRRAPLPVRLAVESSWQATESASLSPDKLTCVFVSGLGDTELTDYMCKTLASEHKELSPTKFHNSVHNAPAGYWTISTNSMSAANSVAGFEYSVSLTLLEAIVQCESEGVPVLVTFYDAPVSPILKPLLRNTEAFAFSLIIHPADSDIEGINVIAQVDNKAESLWPKLHCNSLYISTLYAENPSAKILFLAELLGQKIKPNTPVTIPLSAGSSMSFSLY